MDKNFSKQIGEAINDVRNLKGVTVNYNGNHIDLDKDDIEVSVNIEEFDKHMIAYVVSKMFSEGKIEFVGDCNKDIDYIKKLLEVKDEG